MCNTIGCPNFDNMQSRCAECTLELKDLRAKVEELESAIRQTLENNLHLTDGDNCTLKLLKDSINFE